MKLSSNSRMTAKQATASHTPLVLVRRILWCGSGTPAVSGGAVPGWAEPGGAEPGGAEPASRAGWAGTCGSVDIWRPLEPDGS